MTDKKRAGRKSPYSRPDYYPPESSPQAFKDIVAFMQSNPNTASLREIARECGVSEAMMNIYMDCCSGKPRITAENMGKIEAYAKKL